RIAQKLLAPTMDLFESWGAKETGLFTFAQSPKHIALYQKFGYWPRFLTALMSRPVNLESVARKQASFVKFSALSEAAQKEALDACRKLSDAIYSGLDLTSEIRAVKDRNLGDTLLVWSGSSLDAFAVCHCGEGTEA